LVLLRWFIIYRDASVSLWIFVAPLQQHGNRRTMIHNIMSSSAQHGGAWCHTANEVKAHPRTTALCG
jgi:hypothetical protein